MEFDRKPIDLLNPDKNKTISLGRVRKITHDGGKVPYGQLKSVIDEALGV